MVGQDRRGQRPGPRPGSGLDAVFVRRALTDLRRELDPWRTGYLVGGLQLFWAGPPGADPLTGLDADAPGGDRWPVLAWDGLRATADDQDVRDDAPDPRDSEWGVITSQTCDVMAVGPGARHPTVQVSPLRRLTDAHDPGEIARIARHEMIDYHHVTNPPSDDDWAVDLRISLPVSKAVLLGQEPRSAFRTGQQEHDFSERVAAKVRRPSLHDEVSTTFVDKLRDLVKTARKARHEWPERVEQFRFLVLEGERLLPKKAELLVVLKEDLSAEDRQPLRTAVEAERKRLLTHAIVLTGATFTTLESMRVDAYRRSDPLYVPELGGGAYW